MFWFGFLRINVDLAIFQPCLDLEAGDNQSLKIQVARPGIEPWSSCSASQELNHSATADYLVSTCLKFDIGWKHIIIGFYDEINDKTILLNNLISYIACRIYKFYKMCCRIKGDNESSQNITSHIKTALPNSYKNLLKIYTNLHISLLKKVSDEL